MRVVNKTTNTAGESHEFNTYGLGEIIVYFEDGDASSELISDYDVFLPDGTRKDMRRAFLDHDLVPNNLNTSFAPPDGEAERARGWND